MFWCSTILPLCCYIFMNILNFSITHPYNGFIDLMTGLLLPLNWVYMTLICVTYWLMMSNRIKFFCVLPEYYRTKWDAIVSVLQIRKIAHILLQTAGSVVLCWFMLQIRGGTYNVLLRLCSSGRNDYCLNEKHLFIILHSMYLGISSTLIFFSLNNNLIEFPVIQQSKWGQSRSDLASLLINSAKVVINNLKYFYILYFLCLGVFCKHGIITYFPIHLDDTVPRVDSLFGLLDLGLFLTTWMTGTLLHFASCMFTKMYSAYQTQPYEFFVQCYNEEDVNKKLVDALSCHSFPLLQYQGYQDLCLMAQYSSRRRSELFSLSALGGHPHNWQSISSECLTTLKYFYEEVKNCNAKTMTNGSIRKISGQDARVNESLMQASNLDSLSTTTHCKNDNNESISDKIYSEVSKRKINFLSQNAECTSSSLLAQSQKYIWVIEALSNIVTASYKEDTYGVVQRSLPEIITLFVQLQEEVEKLMKLAITATRSGAENSSALHTRLRVTLKSAIYNVTTLFGKHIESIDLPQEVRKRLGHYTDYKV